MGAAISETQEQDMEGGGARVRVAEVEGEVLLHLERLCCFVIPQVGNYDPKMGAQHTFLKIQYLDHSLTFHQNERGYAFE